MVALLAKVFIRDGQDQVRMRQSYGMLCGMVGIVFNILLFAGKFFAGMAGGSIAITADAFNNLSDAGSSAVTLAGFKLAGAKPDPEHPFGHGRIEYISGLIVAAAILLMAYELIRDSVGKILHPQETEFSLPAGVILAASILVKLYMAYYNQRIGTRIGSAAMHATAMDSLSDACATTVVLAASLAGHYFGIHIDGWCGVLVGIFILCAGIGAARDTLNPLLGQPPDEEFVERIHEIVMSHENICGVHDLIVHDYGPGRQMISLHAEVPAEGDILVIHDVIDCVENELRDRLGCEATIHMDPIVTSDAHIGELKAQVTEIVKAIDPIITLHDFRAVQGPSHTNLIFDVIVPFRFGVTDDELKRRIQKGVTERIGQEYFVVVRVDQAFVKSN